MNDCYELRRFIEAQAPVYQQVCDELKAGHKRSHWMWFIFPQIAGLGSSSMAKRYAISSREEAEVYLRHPVLGPRLIECTQMTNAIEGKSAREILRTPDDLKFCSSMTLFASAAPENPIFASALQKYFGGKRDELTAEKL